MAKLKKPYMVIVSVYGDSGGEPFEKEYTRLKTWAVSPEKAESNARYRVEGKAYWCEEYGTNGNWKSYHYKAIEV